MCWLGLTLGASPSSATMTRRVPPDAEPSLGPEVLPLLVWASLLQGTLRFPFELSKTTVSLLNCPIGDVVAEPAAVTKNCCFKEGLWWLEEWRRAEVGS